MLITTDEAARALGVSDRRVRQYIAAGRLTAHRVNPRCWLVEVGSDGTLELHADGDSSRFRRDSVALSSAEG